MINKENMLLSYTEKKCLRANFGEHIEKLKIPKLHNIQIKSYEKFIQENTDLEPQRKNLGLEYVLRSIFPIQSNSKNSRLDYISYSISKPLFTAAECKIKGLTYSSPLKLKLIFTKNINAKKEKTKPLEQDVYILDMPLMTQKGTFIINGTERVIVSQLHRSPGLFFEIDKTKQNIYTNKISYIAKIIPHRGAWLDIEIDTKNCIFGRIDKKRKFPISILLKALNLNTEEILNAFEKKIPEVETEYRNYKNYITNTLKLENITKQNDAIIELYKIIRPDELISKDTAKQMFDTIFFSNEKYDLSKIGRMKINKRLNTFEFKDTVLCNEDIINIIKKLIDIKEGKDHIDDIDNLGNRRVRSVGEIIENQFKTGFIKIEKSIKEKLTLAENDNLSPNDIVNAKPIAAMIREFFCSSQLSQFMDQINPLSEITHKRRVSALGPGGLTRERAGFEVRDVHNTHYGRICPIETPEGPNIGLINSLAIYAKTDEYGFLETPYIKVENKKITDEIKYLSAIDESDFVIAQANAKICKKTMMLEEDQVSCRFKNEFITISSSKVEYIDISPKQIVSVATALIPFLEHDDANRALMGSNMQRQAVPLLRAEKPLVGTGMEKIVALDSGATVMARRSGIVEKVDASRIIIKADKNEIQNNEIGVDIYNLIKYSRSNQNTCINQKPLVKKGDKIDKDDIIADGPATDLGELALGQNLFVAFMSWNGFNFEDSIIISENVVKENKLTSIHIEELICVARDLKLGPEEITSDIPNINNTALTKLDECGIIYLGSEVTAGDILVGKVTKKSEVQLTPEEKLLQAIFGEKASDVKDSSLKVPQGINGTVIDVQVFTRDALKKDKRTLEIEEFKLKNIKKDLEDELDILKKDILNELDTLILENKKNNQNTLLTLDLIINTPIKEIKNIKIKNKDIKNKIINKRTKLDEIYQENNLKLKELEEKIKRGDDLPPGIIKMVKVSIAIKRRIQVGDKLSGRHGNKGVISTIVPIEDMPYLKNGKTIDIILNPLGVPSRMNVGQVLETHLGWAAKELGEKFKKLKKEEAKYFIEKIYNIKNKNIDINSFNQEDLDILIQNLSSGIPIATPVFDGINEKEIKKLLELADLPKNGKTILYDGRTSMPFENEITIGYQYIMKLNHLIDDKMHARSTGSYSLVSQQPLGGKAQFGGQRFGEMEVWALEAYGAAYTLQEMLTIKSDDISGRTKIYKNVIDNNFQSEPGIPEAFNVLSKEILSLGLNIELDKE
ncbi:MAG TPA: DNA-directed RNA polymerase subunit beta [Candidatus Azoamicus sp.]